MSSKKSLSDFIRQAKQSENSFSSQQVKKLVNSGKKPGMETVRSYHPRKVNRLFNPLKLIVMISIVGMVGMVLIMSLPGEERSSEMEDTVLGVGYSVLGEEEVVSDASITKAYDDLGYGTGFINTERVKRIFYTSLKK